MKEAAILIVLLLGFSHLQMTWAFFLDPFGLFENEAIEQETIVFEDEEITLKDTRTADFNSSFLVVGGLLLGALLLASLGLYALDVYATARIDQFLLDYYGPELYDRYTQSDPWNSVTANAITATTENDYYGYRSLYGLKILSWLERSYLAYEATKEILSDDQCYQQFVCQLVSLPQEDRSWLLQQFEWIWEHSNKHQENCVKKNFTCHKYEKYLEINI